MKADGARRRMRTEKRSSQDNRSGLNRRKMSRSASSSGLIDARHRDTPRKKLAEETAVEQENTRPARMLRAERYGGTPIPAKRISRRYVLAPERQKAMQTDPEQCTFRLSPIPDNTSASVWRYSYLPPTTLWVLAASADQARRLVAVTTIPASASRDQIVKVSPWMADCLVECVEGTIGRPLQWGLIQLSSGTEVAIPRWGFKLCEPGASKRRPKLTVV